MKEERISSSYFVDDDELRKAFQLYSKADSTQNRRMDLFGLKCALLHLYGDDNTFSEFMTIARHYENSRYAGKKQLLQQCFLMIDKKNKGYVNHDDVKELLKSGGVPQLAKKRGSALFEMIDKLGIGKITFSQFCSLYTESTGIHVY